MNNPKYIIYKLLAYLTLSLSLATVILASAVLYDASSVRSLQGLSWQIKLLALIGGILAGWISGIFFAIADRYKGSSKNPK